MVEKRIRQQVDPTAPRFRKTSVNILDDKGFYSYLKKNAPELPYTTSELKSIIKTFNEGIVEAALNNRNGVLLHEGLGVIIVGCCGVKQESEINNTDQSILYRTGNTVAYNNSHTDGYILKIKYTNKAPNSNISKNSFKNNHLWMFDASRKFCRQVAALGKAGEHKRFITFTSKNRLAGMLNKAETKVVHEKEDNLISSHNEFEF